MSVYKDFPSFCAALSLNPESLTSETAKYRHLTVPYCIGNGIDVGSGGNPVISSAISIELAKDAWQNYGSRPLIEIPGCWRGTGIELPFKNRTLDYVYSSHLLEDFQDWTPVLLEWLRVLRPGGNLIILMPECALWQMAIARGQPDNCAHKHCGSVGELTLSTSGFAEAVEDRLTDLWPGDYSILFVAHKFI